MFVADIEISHGRTNGFFHDLYRNGMKLETKITIILNTRVFLVSLYGFKLKYNYVFFLFKNVEFVIHTNWLILFLIFWDPEHCNISNSWQWKELLGKYQNVLQSSLNVWIFNLLTTVLTTNKSKTGSLPFRSNHFY